MVGKMSLLKYLTSNWLGLVFLLQMFLLAMQLHVIWPPEIRLFGPGTAYASIFSYHKQLEFFWPGCWAQKSYLRSLQPNFFVLMFMDGDFPANVTLITFVTPAIAIGPINVPIQPK